MNKPNTPSTPLHTHGKNNGNTANSNPIFESSTPEGHTQKGNAKQLFEFYKNKGKHQSDATMALRFLQSGEHYWRVFQYKQNNRVPPEKNKKSVQGGLKNNETSPQGSSIPQAALQKRSKRGSRTGKEDRSKVDSAPAEASTPTASPTATAAVDLLHNPA